MTVCLLKFTWLFAITYYLKSWAEDFTNDWKRLCSRVSDKSETTKPYPSARNIGRTRTGIVKAYVKCRKL